MELPLVTGQPALLLSKNIKQNRVVGMFDYPELCEYLESDAHH